MGMTKTPSIHSCELNEEWNINNLSNQIMDKAISDGFVFNKLCVDETTCSNSSLFDILFNTRLESHHQHLMFHIMSADNYNNFECSAVFLEDYGRGYDTISSRHRQCPSTSSGSIFYSSWLARKCLVISAGNKRSKTYHQQNVEYDGNDIDPKSDEQGSQGIDVKSAMEIDTDKQHDDQTVLEPVKRINEKLKEKTDDKIYHLYMGISDINNYQEFYEQTNIVQGNTNSNLVRNKETEDTEYKIVAFEYRNVERRVLLNRDIRFGQMLYELKIELGLPASASLGLVNAAKGCIIVGFKANALWKFDDAEEPKYRVIIDPDISE
ncbi:unnamed protein product, partial [Rotaria sp. Silwood1]